MESIRRRSFHRSADHCCLQSRKDCQVCGVRQTSKPPIPVLPESHRLQEAYIRDNRHCSALQRAPYLRPPKCPVPKTRKKRRSPAYAGCMDAPADANRYAAVSADLLPGKTPCWQAPNISPEPYVLLTVQNGRDPPFLVPSGQYSFPQNKDM